MQQTTLLFYFYATVTNLSSSRHLCILVSWTGCREDVPAPLEKWFLLLTRLEGGVLVSWAGWSQVFHNSSYYRLNSKRLPFSSPRDDKPATQTRGEDPQAGAGPGRTPLSTPLTAAAVALLWTPPPGTVAPGGQHSGLRKYIIKCKYRW